MPNYYEIGADAESDYDDDYDDLVDLMGDYALVEGAEIMGRRGGRPSRGGRGGFRGSRGGGRSRGRGRGGMYERALADKAAEQATLVKTTIPTKSREQVLGFDTVTTVAAGASTNVTSQPQVVFRPDRLTISSAIASDFLINDIKIGRSSQLISSDALPADTFSNLSVGVGLKMDTAQISQDITLSVTNVSAGALRFTAALIGIVVE